ncbi:MAG: metallophosphoesterase [Armatimonadota bacterium]
MARSIIVSDLHVDTWTEEPYGEGARRKSKLGHWVDFLDWCEQKRIDELIINGDLLDAPPYHGNSCFTSEIALRAVERLAAYAVSRRVIYIYGNHDIGISGLRCAGTANLAALRNVDLYYPDYVLHTDRSSLLIQHGHLFDPALLLYIKDLTVRTYVASHFQAFQWVQQRRDQNTGVLLRPPGVASPAMIGLGPQVDDNVFYAIKLTDAVSPPPATEVSAARAFIKGLRRGVVMKVGESAKHYLWWEAAKDVFDLYLGQVTVERPLIYCIMGHTHVPDTAEAEIGGKHCVYFNSGTWVGSGEAIEDRQHATYLDVDGRTDANEKGKVWVQDWIRNPYLD